MSLRIEWRSRDTLDDSLVAVEEQTNTVVRVWPVDPDALTDFLNDMEGFAVREPEAMSNGQADPESFGELVLSRSEDGDVIHVDPELYWIGIADWFRSRGADPHPWRGRR